MTDPVRWNTFRDRFHADELARSDVLRSEVEQVLRQHGELSEPQLQARMREFDRLFGSDDRIYDGQRRGQAELRALWNSMTPAPSRRCASRPSGPSGTRAPSQPRARRWPSACCRRFVRA